MRSTVPPGTTEQVVAPLLAETSGRCAGTGFRVASNPEFLRAASAEDDCSTIPRRRSPSNARNLYNAAKISFWNEMRLVCQKLGIDHDQVSSTVADSAEGSFNREYGIRGGAPYGGACLPKDTSGLLGFCAGLGVEMPLLEAVIEVNDVMRETLAREIDRAQEAARGSEPVPLVAGSRGGAHHVPGELTS